MQSNTIDQQQTKAGDLDDDEYFVSEVFYSLQGEGVQTGRPMTFVRFGGCNLRCRQESVGFDCDTDFRSGQVLTADAIAERISEVREDVETPFQWVLFTGGEPGLQVDETLLRTITKSCNDPRYAIETNGTVELDCLSSSDWICVSPKSAWHTIRQRTADELKLVRAAGQSLPDIDDLPVNADHYIVSPACLPSGGYDPETLRHCAELAKAEPAWRLSLQTHKILGVR